jgi:hypothetical protein
MANRVLAGYPQPVGEKYEMYVDIDGPTSYLNSAVFSTSGQQINAADFGFGGFESVELVSDASSDGVNSATVVLGATTAGATNLSPIPSAPPGPVVSSAVIHWYTTINGTTEVANATNLSAKYFRFRIRAV